MDNELTYVGKITSSSFIRTQQIKHFIVMDVTLHLAVL